MSEKKAYETAAHANDGYVTKDAPLILFRGALDHCQAEIIITQTILGGYFTMMMVVDLDGAHLRFEEIDRELQPVRDELKMTIHMQMLPLKKLFRDILINSRDKVATR